MPLSSSLSTLSSFLLEVDVDVGVDDEDGDDEDVERFDEEYEELTVEVVDEELLWSLL